jgi:protocatechuate 3,4-dioxygenase beta subunit
MGTPAEVRDVIDAPESTSGYAERRRTPDQILGPYFPLGHAPTKGGDLTAIEGRHGSAQGEIIEVVGRVLDRGRKPVRRARIVIWQANSFGRYAHPNDMNPAPLDPNFVGFADIQSGDDGGYRIKTVRPGAYAVGPDWVRPPHIHFEVLSKFKRLITQMYFPGEPLNAGDRVLRSALHPDMLIAANLSPQQGLPHRVLKFDIVLARG